MTDVATPEPTPAEAARQALLRGKTIVFFTPGSPSKRFVYERAHALGVRVVIVDEPGSWARALVEEGVAARLLELEMAGLDEDDLFDRALAALTHLRHADPSFHHRLDGLTTFCEMAVGTVARLAEALGLPGAPVSAIEIARNKYATRACMSAAGLATPANALVTDSDDLAGALHAVGVPAVLKPICGAASLGVVKVGAAEELPGVFARARAQMEDTVVTSGALVPRSSTSGSSASGGGAGLDATAAAAAAAAAAEAAGGGLALLVASSASAASSVGSALVLDEGSEASPRGERGAAPPSLSGGSSAAGGGCAFMLEEYLDGCEVDVDVVLREGEPLYAVVVDNGPTQEPYFAETWGLCPSLLPRHTQAELRELAVASLRCCGFVDGVFHVELKATSRGPRLIEINARMGGGQVRETHRRVHGVDLVDETLHCCVGTHAPAAPLGHCGGAEGGGAQPAARCSLAYSYVSAAKSGVVEHTDALHGLAQLPHVVYAKPLVARGDAVTGACDGLPTWVADVMVTRSTSAEALESVLALSSGLEIPLQPHGC